MRIKTIVLILVCFSLSCGIGAGTHGSIKAYKYPVKKSELENAVDIVLKNNANVKRDSTHSYRSYDSTTKVMTFSLDSTAGSTRETDYYNDGKGYVTIYINNDERTYEYIFRYYGDSVDWTNSPDAELFICYAYDEKRDGGCDGHGDFNWKHSLKKKLTDRFENEFLDKIDKQLGKAHKDAD